MLLYTTASDASYLESLVRGCYSNYILAFKATLGKFVNLKTVFLTRFEVR